MKFIRSLYKPGYAIYLYELAEGRYVIEYSDDGFGSKERKEFNLILMFQKRYTEKEMPTIIKSLG